MLVWMNRYVPGYLKELQEGHAEELNLFKTQLSELKKKAVRSTPLHGIKPPKLTPIFLKDRGEELPPSFGKYLIERQAELDLSMDEMAYLAGSMFGAGSDTSASAISISVMAAALHPEAQARVQAELDAVIGRERAPTMADEEMLPQTKAFVLETLRWRPVSAGGECCYYWRGNRDAE